MLNIVPYKALCAALLLGYSSLSYAADSSRMTTTSYTQASPRGYVLASGIFTMPYQPAGANFFGLGRKLIINTNGVQCGPSTPRPFVTVALNAYRTFETWDLGQIYVQPFNWQLATNTVYDPIAVWSPVDGGYVIGVLLAAQNGNNNWWTAVGINWTLYCLP